MHPKPDRLAFRDPPADSGPIAAPVPPRSEATVLEVAPPSRQLDPRLYQIAALSALLAYGLVHLRFDVEPHIAAILLASALGTQYACTRAWRLDRFEPRSALISGLSLCLLLRTQSPFLAVLGASVAIASKFVLRIRGKHVFNPTNLGLVVLLLCTDRVWVSPGQWGSTAFFGFLIACLGGLVVHRASRKDVTAAFLLFYAAILCARSLWLGQPWSIPLHRLQNGALLLFAFFMISDPRTTPDSRAGRVLFALLVAAGTAWIQFVLYRQNGLLWSLAVFSALVPLLDRLLPGRRYAWGAAPPLARPAGGVTGTDTRCSARRSTWDANRREAPAPSGARS